jgi:hypothetical protein
VGDIAQGGSPQLTLQVDDTAAARRLLGAEPRVRQIDDDGRSLTVVLDDGLGPADVNRALVGAGIAVSRLEPSRVSLEERFLEITSRLEVRQ